ncbi:thioredoxin domain-containing protein-like [Haliotis cracherodii]|uniref:thioredoxin domain-containing protein-like n=1 Tax=Haliotis cracherodii TaxID=6455 RepID=UPI0039ED7807
MVIARARNFCLIWTLLLNLQLIVPVFTEEPVQPPSVEEATKDNFVTFARNNPYLLVLFYEPGCVTCEEAKLVMSQLETPELFPGELKKIQISDVALAATYGAFTSPGFVLFRHGTGSPVVYDGVTVDTENIGGWLDVASDVATKSLTDDSFEHLTQAATGATTGDWLVAYYKDSCSKILFAMESFGVRMKRKMNIAKVAMETNPRLVKRMKVTKCPSVIFYKQGKMYRYEVEKYDTKSLTSFVEGWYKNMKAESVPVDPSSFDELTDNIAKALKDQIEGPNRFTFLTIAGGVVSLVLLILVCACVMSRRAAERKKKLF